MNKFLFKILRYSGLSFLFREIIQRNKVSILLFHDLSKNSAEKVFKILTQKYNLIDLNDFIAAIEKKDKTKIPKKALIITFDDGHIRNYEALEVIKKYNIPITIFLCASIINSNRHFWFKYKNKKIDPYELKGKSNIFAAVALASRPNIKRFCCRV